ncbi:response regulator transcription factor [Streptomyces monticola]|uniref:Response regulator transcription factor n=1 Tax=Streptomyces monticola TaxID=2666263 RepID=A0ABW2JE42_9ACTN
MASSSLAENPEALPRALEDLLASTRLQLVSIQRLLDALRDVDGERAARVAPAADTSQDPLTAREYEVLRLLVTGLANRQIAARLGISDHTVRAHLQSVFRKLGVTHRTEAAVAALKFGLVTSGTLGGPDVDKTAVNGRRRAG